MNSWSSYLGMKRRRKDRAVRSLNSPEVTWPGVPVRDECILRKLALFGGSSRAVENWEKA